MTLTLTLQVVDIPREMRSISQFRTTLGHKTNSAFFDERNAEFDTVRHAKIFANENYLNIFRCDIQC